MGARCQPPLRPPQPATRQRFRRKLLALVRRQRTIAAVAAHRRSVPHPRVRDDAAADAGRSRAAEVSRVARRSIRRSRRWPRADEADVTPRGVRSATTSGRSGCMRSRARRSRATAASCRRTTTTLLSFKGIGAYTAGAIRSFAFRRARRDPRHQRRARAVPRLRRQGRSQGARHAAAPVGRVRSAGAAASTCSTSTRR